MENFFELLVSFSLATFMYVVSIMLIMVGISLISISTDSVFFGLGITLLSIGIFLLFLKIRWDIRDVKQTN